LHQNRHSLSKLAGPMATPVMVSSEKVMSAVNSADVLIPAADTSANLVDGLNLYPTDTREPIDHLLLESIVKELIFLHSEPSLGMRSLLL
ncbi:hypothetical protein BVRB_029260, partial [Beta vulgaris subsp. vulgaris]